MLQGDVQGLEIVPGVFDLRPVGHGEAQPAHDVLQLLDRLRDRVQMAQPRADAGHRGIELARASALPAALFASRSIGRVEGRLDLLLDLVEALAGGGLVGLVDRAQALLHVLQPAAPGAEELDPRGFQRRRHRRPPRRRPSPRGQDRPIRPESRRGPW